MDLGPKVLLWLLAIMGLAVVLVHELWKLRVWNRRGNICPLPAQDCEEKIGCDCAPWVLKFVFFIKRILRKSPPPVQNRESRVSRTPHPVNYWSENRLAPGQAEPYELAKRRAVPG